MLQSRIDRVDSFRKKVCSETHQLQGNAAIAAAWNLDGTRLAVASDDKVLEIWDAATPGWKSLNSRKSVKKCMALRFHEDCLYLADKSGDVYQYSVEKATDTARLILGHVSILLDLEISPDGRYILTADRDEKLRVSHLPNAYNIQCFCLGHSGYVSQVRIPPLSSRYAISGSEDGCLGVWAIETGEKVAMKQVAERKGKTVTNVVCSSSSEIIAVTLNRCDTVFVYSFHPQSNDLASCGVVEVPGEVLSLDFDCKDILWVLTADSKQPVSIVKFSEEKASSISVEDFFGSINAVIQDSSFFKDRPVIRDWNLLRKASLRNDKL